MHVKYLHALLRTLLCVQQVTARVVKRGDTCVAKLDNDSKAYPNSPPGSCSDLRKRDGEADLDDDCDEALEELSASDYGIEQTDFHKLTTGDFSGLSCAALLSAVILVSSNQPKIGRRDEDSTSDCKKAREIILNGSSSGNGRKLAEIFWVRINNIDGENPGDLYGTIAATDSEGKQDIYKKERADYDSIKPGQNAYLTGPSSRSISAKDGFVLEFQLIDKDADPSPDDQISFGEFVWKEDGVHDQIQETTVMGAYGSATANYVVMSNAAQAEIDVVLINGDEENPADIYGTVLASTKFGKRELFNKNDKSYVEIAPGQKLPLSRSVLAVPMDDLLVFDVDVWDHDSDPSSNDEVAKGKFELVPELSSSTKKLVNGKYGQVEIRVTWS